MSKYNSKKVEVDGIIFDSKKEAKRFKELKALESKGFIKDLKRQVKFILIPAQYKEEVGPRGGIKKTTLERECAYYADFTYIKNGELIIPEEVTKISPAAFKSTFFKRFDSSSVTKITINGKVEIIQPRTFAGFSSLKTINLPLGLTLPVNISSKALAPA